MLIENGFVIYLTPIRGLPILLDHRFPHLPDRSLGAVIKPQITFQDDQEVRAALRHARQGSGSVRLGIFFYSAPWQRPQLAVHGN